MTVYNLRSRVCRERGDVAVLLVLIGAVLMLMLGTGANLYVSHLEKKVLQEKDFRVAESSAYSALEITNALITSHTIVKDSVTGKWSYDPSQIAVAQNDYSFFQAAGAAYSNKLPEWVAKALEAKAVLNASQFPPRPIFAVVGFPGPVGKVDNNILTAPEHDVLFLRLTPTAMVEFVKPGDKGEELAVFVDAKPFPKVLRARVGGLCQDFDPEPYAMIHRNIVGGEPSFKIAPSFYNEGNYPIINVDLLAVEQGLRASVADNTDIINERLKLKRTGEKLVSELYLMYLFRPPTAAETKFLLDALKAGTTSFEQVEATMKTSPVFRFINLKNDSNFYTTNAEGAKILGLADAGLEFYVYGNSGDVPFDPTAIPPFSPDLATLYSCHDVASDVYSISLSSCGDAKALGYVFKTADPGRTFPIYEHDKGTATSRVSLAENPSKTPLAYASKSDSTLASAIGLFRTYLRKMGTEPFAYSSAYSYAREYDKTLTRDADLTWLDQIYRSQKSYYDMEACGPKKMPGPKCFLTGPSQLPKDLSQLPKGFTPQIKLVAYGEFTEIEWDGAPVNPGSSASTAKNEIIETPARPFEAVPVPLTAEGLVNSTATVSMVEGGKTTPNYCNLPRKSVDFKVKPTHPNLSQDYVIKKGVPGYSSYAFSFGVTPHDLKSPSCLIYSSDRSYVSKPFIPTENNREFLFSMDEGVVVDTLFTLYCSDSEHSVVIAQSTARVFPMPTCNLTATPSSVTVGYNACLSLVSTQYPENANWDGTIFSTFPSAKTQSGSIPGFTSVADVKGPGGSLSCNTYVGVTPVPPDICNTVCTPAAATTPASSPVCTTNCYPAPRSQCTGQPPLPQVSAILSVNGLHSPQTFAPNAPFSVEWTSVNADSCTISALGWNQLDKKGQKASSAPASGSIILTLTCTGASGSASDSVEVSAKGAVSAKLTVNDSHDPLKVAPKSKLTLKWTSSGADSCSIAPLKLSKLKTSGATDSNAPATGSTKFVLTCTGSSGSATDSVDVSVGVDCTPGIVSKKVDFEEFREAQYITDVENEVLKKKYGVSFKSLAGGALRIAKIVAMKQKGQPPESVSFEAWASVKCKKRPNFNRLCDLSNKGFDTGEGGSRALSTSGAMNTNLISLQIDYVVPTQKLSFDLLDVDGQEDWDVIAFDDSNPPKQLDEAGAQGHGYGKRSGNSDATRVSLSSSKANITRVIATGTKNSRIFGFGFDNFTTGLTPCK